MKLLKWKNIFLSFFSIALVSITFSSCIWTPSSKLEFREKKSIDIENVNNPVLIYKEVYQNFTKGNDSTNKQIGGVILAYDWENKKIADYIFMGTGNIYVKPLLYELKSPDQGNFSYYLHGGSNEKLFYLNQNNNTFEHLSLDYRIYDCMWSKNLCYTPQYGIRFIPDYKSDDLGNQFERAFIINSSDNSVKDVSFPCNYMNLKSVCVDYKDDYWFMNQYISEYDNGREISHLTQIDSKNGTVHETPIKYDIHPGLTHTEDKWYEGTELHQVLFVDHDYIFIYNNPTGETTNPPQLTVLNYGDLSTKTVIDLNLTTRRDRFTDIVKLNGKYIGISSDIGTTFYALNPETHTSKKLETQVNFNNANNLFVRNNNLYSIDFENSSEIKIYCYDSTLKKVTIYDQFSVADYLK